MSQKEYTIARNKRTGKYGVKKTHYVGWWIAPIYDAIQGEEGETNRNGLWVKREGKFGYLNIAEQREQVPCEYGFPLYFQGEGYAEAWKDYKAGVVNLKGDVVVPIIYNRIVGRYEDVSDEKLPHRRHAFCGFACLNNDGSTQAYDRNMQPCGFKAEEVFIFSDVLQEWNEPENATRTIEEIEDRIREEYEVWRKMGGGMPHNHACRVDNEEADAQKDKIIDLLHDRRHQMNYEWLHNKENADRINRTNQLLQRAVEKAIRLGRKTAKSVEWMNRVSNLDGYCYETEVAVYPQWTNSKSEVGYKPTKGKGERERLIEEEDNCHHHIWNIIAAMSDCYRIDGVGACFHHAATSADPKEWALRTLMLDDGQSWDELIHYPAYMDCYFLIPFHNLYCDLFLYSLEDIARMNDFRVRVNVKLETRESFPNV